MKNSIYRIPRDKLALFFLFGLFLIFTANCQNSSDTRLENRLRQIETGKLFTLDTLWQGDWDFVCIISPYQDDKEILREKNISREKAKLVRNNVFFDSVCTLLFMEGNYVKEVLTVKRNIADFAIPSDTVRVFGRKTILRMNMDRKISVYVSSLVLLPILD